MEWNTEWNGIGNGTLHGTEVWNRGMEQSWNGKTLSGTDAWNITGKEILLSGTAAWNRSLEHMHGIELEPKYFCLEQLH